MVTENKFPVRVLILTVAITMILGACKTTEAPTAETEPEERLRVAALLPGVIYDNSWTQFGYEGLVKAEQDCGIEFLYTENVQQAEQIEVYRNYASQGYDIVIGHGGQYFDSAKTVADEFPDTQFVVVNGFEGYGNNVSGITVDNHQMGWLAGALACNMTKTNKVGMVIGNKLPINLPAIDVFPTAAQSCGKDVETNYIITGDWEDVNLAYEATASLIEDGYDVIWQLLNAADVGVFSAAEDAGVMAIGYYSDQSSIAPKAIIGSTVASPTTQMYEAACGRVTDGEVVFLDTSMEGGIGVALNEDLVPPEVFEAMDQVIEELKRGEHPRPQD